MAGGAIKARLAAALAPLGALRPRLRRVALPLALLLLLAVADALLFVLVPSPETEVAVAMPPLVGRIGGEVLADGEPAPGGVAEPRRAEVLPPLEVPAVPSLPERRRPPLLAELPVLNQSAPLPEAPVPELVEEAPEGALPRIGPDGEEPWRVYARPVPEEAAGRPRVAVVVTGLGLDSAVTATAIAKLPAEVTLAFSPYASDLPYWIAQAREAGHEALLGLPVQSPEFPVRDAGPLRLRPDEEPEKTVTRLNTVLAKAGGYVGVLTPANGALDDRAVAAVLKELRRRGLMHVAGRPPAHAGPPTVAVDLRLDDAPFRDALAAKLNWLERVAAQRGHAVAVTEPLPVVLHHLAEWLPGLEELGLTLAPVSSIPEVEVQS